ncbi:MAG: Stp1/IreP family PP2C-type Ser/Thr phosphatase [Chlamydiota bacterium]|jgi:protein phosphatase
MKYSIKTFGFSDIGLTRKNNEDAFIALDQHNFFALADGMGGHNAGEIAAKKTIQSLSEYVKINFRSDYFKISLKEVITDLNQSIYEANQLVFNLSRDHESFQGMGTTVCCLYLHNADAIFAHVGDSRVYLYRNNILHKLTEDHSLSKESFKEVPHPYKNIITRAIGIQSEVLPDIGHIKIKKDDIFFLCSDGLTDFLHHEEIKNILKHKHSLKLTVQKLIDNAKENGSRDNITILMVKIHE